jgi:hypothetical protein
MSARKIRAVAVAALVGLGAVACDSGTRSAQDTAPANEAPTVNPQEVAMGFLEAYGAFDAETAMTYVADDADLAGLIDPQVPPDTEGLSAMLALLEALGYEQTITSCQAATIASDTSVVCKFDFHAIRSDEIGRGPFSGSIFTFIVRDGEIVRAALSWNIEQFSPQMWEPFAAWVSSTYPKDFDVMYMGGGNNFRLTEESIRLWRRHSREYVEEVGG